MIVPEPHCWYATLVADELEDPEELPLPQAAVPNRAPAPIPAAVRKLRRRTTHSFVVCVELEVREARGSPGGGAAATPFLGLPGEKLNPVD